MSKIGALVLGLVVIATAITVTIVMMQQSKRQNVPETYEMSGGGSDDPIDLVVTWVCPDPVNDTLRDYYSGTSSASKSSRTQSREELLCLLRGVDMFAPWINHVYIVSNTGYPAWLDVDNARVTVVTDDVIFPDPSCLPTFNSQAVESRLHHIPGLSEKYLYCNDDMFFGSPVSPSDFFDEQGRARFFPSGRIYGRMLSDFWKLGNYTKSVHQTKSILKVYSGINVKNHILHQATPMLKSVAFSAEETYSDIFHRQARMRLRWGSHVSCHIYTLFVHYGLHVGKFVKSNISSVFLTWEKRNTIDKKLKKARKNPPKLLCINNLDDYKNDVWQKFWREYYHQQSSFEKWDVAQQTTDLMKR